jgi:hypothetical protein
LVLSLLFFLEELGMIKPDTCTTAFAALRSAGDVFASEEWTESDTRSKFIDTLLIDCLGWSEPAIKRESAQKKLRLDYILSTTQPAMVVEAKRAGVDLAVAKQKGPRRLKLTNLIKANPGLTEAIQQVAEYCWNWSSPIAVLTNGRALITFIGNRSDGIKWQEGDAIVISDIFSDDCDFSDIYGLLSKDAVTEGKTIRGLIRDAPASPPVNALSTYSAPNAIVPRNMVGSHLESLIRQVFTDVSRDDSTEVIEHCYVLPGETTLRDQEFESLLLDRPPAYVSSVIDVGSGNSFRKFQAQIADCLTLQHAAQTLLVIGGVGVGKTMFLKRFFLLNPDNNESRRDTCAFFIDFRTPDLDPSRIGDLVYRRVREQIEALDEKPVPGQNNTYDLLSQPGLIQVFWPQVANFNKLAKTIKEADPAAYEKLLLDKLLDLKASDRDFVIGACRVLRERYHRHVCIILDNADQCEPVYQAAAYIFSRTLENDTRSLIIVALREEWYWHHGARGGGPLSAYHDLVYHIPAPRARDVLALRLEYAIKQIEATLAPSTEFSIGNVVIEAEHFATYLRVVYGAFLKDERITLFYESIANGSVRKGLEIFLDFLRSGHTDADQYLKAIIAKDEYVLLLPQVFKSIAFGNYSYYASYRSPVPNLFAPASSADYTQSYLTKAYFLNWASMFVKTNASAGIGFIPIGSAKAVLVGLGLTDGSDIDAIQTMVDEGVIAPDIQMTDDRNAWSHVRITTKGLYILRRMPNLFSYWEAVMLDTPLTDKKLLTRISLLYQEGTKPSLHQRLLCVREFVEFLEQAESLEQVRVASAGLTNECGPLMPSLVEHAKTDFALMEAESRAKPYS